jgi:hypothetical protein
MSMRSGTSAVTSTNTEATNFVSDEFIQDIWVNLAGQVTREHIYEVATEVASEYKDAKVTTFLPILIRRQTLERLEVASQGGWASAQ